METINKVRNELNQLKYGDSVRSKINEQLDDKTMNNPLNARHQVIDSRNVELVTDGLDNWEGR